jgi:alginate O-acetyltransferase complex protein AlgI
MSYTIEVYRRRQEPERNLGRFALYVLFYPQLVAGPIERPQNLLRQFRTEQRFDYSRVRDGLLLMGWGLFKKIAIADRLSGIVNVIYGQQSVYAGSALLIATYCFAIQIYCDFSGYSDIAIGAARVMGFGLMKNFSHPYFSCSVSEFWTRWHISLSTWFRDYVYIPMGGRRVSALRRCVNLMVVFSISGLWHGANWTYVIWGALNGVYLIISVLTKRLRSVAWELAGVGEVPHVRRMFGMVVTFHLILLSWIFFRAESLSAAMSILKGIMTWRPGLGAPLTVGGGSSEIGATLSLFLIAEIVQSRGCMLEAIRSRPVMVRFALYCAALSALILFGQFGSSQQFIYFQF